MEFVRAQSFETRVADSYYLTENGRFLLVKLELVEPERIVFQAGQYVSVKIDSRGTWRSYSIASTPDDQHGVVLVVEIVDGGLGSEYLAALKPGDKVEILGPLGRFVVTDGAEKRLLVATGCGVVPVYAMINDLLINRAEKGPIRLHWGLRSEEDIFWLDNLQRLADEHKNFVFDIVLSQPPPEWELCTGHVQDCLRRDFAPEASGQEALSGWDAYICGNPEMVEDVAKLVTELGVKDGSVHTERFA